MAPGAIVTGASTSILSRYVPQNIIGWVLVTSGIGGWLTFNIDSSTGMWVGLQYLAGWGMGMLFPATNLACIAPLPLRLNAHALAFYAFVRSFFMASRFNSGSECTLTSRIGLGSNNREHYSPERAQVTTSIGVLSSLSGWCGDRVCCHPNFAHTGTRAPRARFVGALTHRYHGWVLTSSAPVLDAFAESLKRIWLAMTIVSAVGLLCSFGLKEIPMATVTDEQWGVKEKKKREDTEKGGASTPRETTDA